tara:strand:+ start:117 stop:296 length:180 start_codon:yes stop_codon:yes gene_type:complete
LTVKQASPVVENQLLNLNEVILPVDLQNLNATLQCVRKRALLELVGKLQRKGRSKWLKE